eukprot:c4_g1_i1.p1 GENE.c4_g1_i1~~c4_g1_i1.p1  ORF type:complete len:533 (-),score=151.34 c4_g1_i1:63-1571(-)
MVVVYVKSGSASIWTEVGRTERLTDTLNPDFAQLVFMEYRFEEIQSLKFLVVDVDNKKTDVASQDQLGEFETKLATIVSSGGRQITGPLKKKGHAHGTITCRVDEVLECKQALTIHFAADKLDNKDFFGKSDPYLIISRARGDGTWLMVHKTEVIDNNLSPVWAEFTISLVNLCNSLVDIPLLIECFDDDGDGKKGDLIGQCQVTTRQLIEGANRSWALVNPSKKKNGGVAGSLKVLRTLVVTEYSFLDYLAGGCEVSMFAAVDFTGSNGNPSQPSSLHYIRSDGQLNEYESALTAVGSVLLPYDSDGLFQMFGFGAKIQGAANHCFVMTQNPAGAVGVQGMLEAYRNVIHGVELWGPTNFATIINTAASIASQYQSQQQQKYFVLLILTDGVITDVDETKKAIIQASRLPLSIVIVGVGSADFTDMNALDSDDGLLKHGGLKAVRDIVQFVPFRSFIGNKEELAKATLKEIPGQMLSFFKFAQYVPNPPRPIVTATAAATV